MLTLLVAAVLGAGPSVKEGDKFPDVELPAVMAGKPELKSVKLSDYSSGPNRKNVVLYFYPKAMTGGCTKESCGFRDKMADLGSADTVVLGISTDNLEDQKKFIDKEKLNFALLADADKKFTEKLGILNPQRGLAARYTFVIDKEGVLRKVYAVKDVTKHPGEVYEYIKANLTK